MTRIDFGRHSDDYATHRPGPPGSFYERLDGIAPLRGARCIDLGTGPGLVALELAARGAAVVGIDVSEEQIAAARSLAAGRGLQDLAGFRVGRAEATGLKASAYDLVTASQCWHWFEGAAALAEVRRVLRPGGTLAIVSYCYLAAHSPVAQDTEALILERNPSWGMAGATGVFPDQIDEVLRGGLSLVEAFAYDHDEAFSHARWRGRIRTCHGVGSGGLSPDAVRRFDDDLARLLSRKYPDPVTVPHRVWCVAGRTRGGG